MSAIWAREKNVTQTQKLSLNHFHILICTKFYSNTSNAFMVSKHLKQTFKEIPNKLNKMLAACMDTWKISNCQGRHSSRLNLHLQ